MSEGREVVAVRAASGPLGATVRVPGSKSLTNRALLCAALADGTSVLRGVLEADDTAAMRSALVDLGVAIEMGGSADDPTATVHGCGGRFPADGVTVDARQSGTTARFLLPVLATMPGSYRLTGSPQLRARPFSDLLVALREAGVRLEDHDGFLPVTIGGGVHATRVEVSGDVTSQFLSGLMLAAPLLPDGMLIECTSAIVSRPYVEMTARTMAQFGVTVSIEDRTIVVAGGGYRPADVTIEPDASSASYFLAAPLITAGQVTVLGLTSSSVQGDVAFVDVLSSMGATIAERNERSSDGPGLVVTASGPPLPVDVDLADMPDLALTVAAVAYFATGPTTVRNVAVIRGHESDRLAVIRDELTKLGATVDLTHDSFTITPPARVDRRPARIDSHDDHRVAMAFALVGLGLPGVEITDPTCVAKTFPGFWDTLASLRTA